MGEKGNGGYNQGVSPTFISHRQNCRREIFASSKPLPRFLVIVVKMKRAISVRSSQRNIRRRLFTTMPRPIRRKRDNEKVIKRINTVTINGNQHLDLYTCTFPCTVRGIMVKLTFRNENTSLACNPAIMIYHRREGQSVQNINNGNNTDFTVAPDNVICWEAGSMADKASYRYLWDIEMVPKTGRKMRPGDTLAMTIQNDNSNTGVDSAIQFFLID